MVRHRGRPHGTRNRHDTNKRDRVDKLIGYAEADIPVYLLVDRDNNTVTVFSEPKDGRYQQFPSYPWGPPWRSRTPWVSP
ncbi:Uma2 family endonuclease [Streptomyces europaeiscabiei]|uniref:Uma2 family endonuclease n=1 Tax=Streptomyces europaeiscabiei TaxID=146819 RepID=UPI0029AFE252|nr:Uma2 family endonuclease [Streptomyces europaeiscabiei]MDX3696519.1 Uma2 family endonuclease [Streptomyces europaeiscabiei]